MTPTEILNTALDVFEPRPEVGNLRWAIDHAWTFDGKPYQHNEYPHIGAPGGPFPSLVYDPADPRREWEFTVSNGIRVNAGSLLYVRNQLSAHVDIFPACRMPVASDVDHAAVFQRRNLCTVDLRHVG